MPYGTNSYDYTYYLGDNLGNTRITFGTRYGKDSVQQKDDYYPFGMEINWSTLSPKNEYLYNKKELQEELTVYDYGARFYDPVIGRWTSVDPLAEKMRRYSPYNYVFDDPMRFVDPDGMGPGDPDVENDPFFLLKVLTTIVYDAKHAVFNNVSRSIHLPYRERYKVVDGNEVFESEIYKEKAPKTLKQAGAQLLGAAGDALMIIPGEGQAGRLFTTTATESTAGREASELLNPFDLQETHGLTLSKKQYGNLKTDIKENGMTEPINYIEHNGTKHVVNGHHRLRIAKELGHPTVPAQKVTFPFAGYKTPDDLFWTRY